MNLVTGFENGVLGIGLLSPACFLQRHVDSQKTEAAENRYG